MQRRRADKHKQPETEWGLFFLILAIVTIGAFYPLLLKILLVRPLHFARQVYYSCRVGFVGKLLLINQPALKPNIF